MLDEGEGDGEEFVVGNLEPVQERRDGVIWWCFGILQMTRARLFWTH